MVSKSDNNKHLVYQESRFNELIMKVTPDVKFNCLGSYEESTVHNSFESNKQLCDCNILEIVTDIYVGIRNFKRLIKNAGYRLLDVTYESDGFHFFVRNVSGKEM